MIITNEDREWIDARADQLFRESERQRSGIRPNTTLPQDYRDYFVVQAAWERAADALIEAERRGAERMRERAALLADADALYQRKSALGCDCWKQEQQYEASARKSAAFASAIRALPLTEETPDADT